MNDLNIQMVDLKNQYLKIKDEIDKAINDVVESTQFIQGKIVTEFEKNCAFGFNTMSKIAQTVSRRLSDTRFQLMNQLTL